MINCESFLIGFVGVLMGILFIILIKAIWELLWWE